MSAERAHEAMVVSPEGHAELLRQRNVVGVVGSRQSEPAADAERVTM
jgi:hypothetical protein